MKKMYKKPQTEKVPLVPETPMLHLSDGGSNPTGKPSEPGANPLGAPRRQA
mgnify:CR=1 FL=1